MNQIWCVRRRTIVALHDQNLTSGIFLWSIFLYINKLSWILANFDHHLTYLMSRSVKIRRFHSISFIHWHLA